MAAEFDIEIELIIDHTVEVQLINSGLNTVLCPIIDCVDGGTPSTTVYDPVNGLLKGGTP